jgi:preprotein translocase subunit SecE
MARDRKRAKQRQRSRQQAANRPTDPAPESPAADEPEIEAPAAADDEPGIPIHAQSEDPLFPQSRSTLEPPDPVADASGPAEEAKIVLEEGDVPSPLKDELAPTDEAKGRVFPDELEDIPDEGPIDTAPAKRGKKSTEARRDGNKFVNFIKACWAELQRVQWPDRKQVAQATAVVLVFVVIAGSYLGLMDAIFSRLVNLIL